MRQQPKPPFDNLEAANGVCVADGWGLKIHVNQGHLVVEDGIGQSRRTRRYHKATSGLTRLVILGHSGYQSFEAVRWLADAKISTVHIDTDGTVLTASTSSIDNPALRRAQALAADNKAGIEVIRYLLGLKISRQRDNANRLGEGAEEIQAELESVATAQTLDDLRIYERQAAVVYWRAWSTVEMPFVRNDHKRVPEHWKTLGQRRSPQSASGRRAVNPINAILNYLYALLEAEARIATIAVGLDPGLGILHLDKYARDSLGLDLMEAVRPQVDAYVLDLLDGHRFRAADFHDTRTGNCRIAHPLTHALSETTLLWRNHLAEPAENVVRVLSASPESKIRNRATPLTQSHRREAKGSSWTGSKTVVRLTRNCEQCGHLVADKGKLCTKCREQFNANAIWLEAGRAVLASLRDSGVDPAHGGEAADKRGQTNRDHQHAVAEWNAQNRVPDPDVFEHEILPGLQEVSLREMAASTGLSIDYCSKIRRGLRVPHPRHWSRLSLLLTQRAAHSD